MAQRKQGRSAVEYILVLVIAVLVVTTLMFLPVPRSDSPTGQAVGNTLSNRLVKPDTCTDTDGGKNKEVRGIVSGLRNGKSYSKKDYCQDSNTVKEYVCKGNQMREFLMECEAGEVCKIGACVSNMTCVDSDGGVDYYVRGEVSGFASEPYLFNEKGLEGFEGLVVLSPTEATLKLFDETKDVALGGTYEFSSLTLRVEKIDFIGKDNPGNSIEVVIIKVVDTCSGNSLREFYCKPGSALPPAEFYECPYGCRDGACQPEPLPIAYWRFDEGQGNVVRDSADANHGTFYGENWEQICISGSCASFNGRDSYVQVMQHGEFLTLGDELTIEAWVNVRGGENAYRSVITRRDGGGGKPTKGWMLYVGDNNKWQFWLSDGYSGWTKIKTDAGVELNKWTYIAVTYSDGKASIYVDGEVKNSSAVPTTVLNSDRPLRIGAGVTESRTAKLFFNGLIDEVRIYNKTLTEYAIREHYEELRLAEGRLRVATVRDAYNIGEKVELTDPPEETHSIVYESAESKLITLATKEVYSQSYTPEGRVYDRTDKAEIPKKTQERLAKLDDSAISELAESRKRVSEEKKTLNKYEKAYADAEIKDPGKASPLAYAKRSQAKKDLDMQKAKVEKAESNLRLKLDKYGVPEELNKELDEIEEKATTWTPNYNRILLQTDEYRERLLGLKLSGEEAKELSAEKRVAGATVADSSLPDYFDWRNQHGEDYITPVKDQLFCGSCWAFADVGALEGAINAYYNNPDIDADLSEQDLVSCSGAGDCVYGGWPEDALDYIKNNGISDESCFPYSATDEPCGNKCDNWETDAWKIVSYSSPELTVEAIKRTVMENGPVVVGMEVYYDFYDYTGGIYYHIYHIYGNPVGYHAVTIVGWGVYDGLEYWIVKNSWGDDSWGENGYFRISAGECNIDSWFAFAVEQPVAPYDEKRICQDKDSDGYCNWGIGERPSTCPSNCQEIGDCDDSDGKVFEGCGRSAEKTGLLTVSSEPEGADVYVFNEGMGGYIYRGETPLKIKLDIGEREVKIAKEDYVDNVTVIDIQENTKTDIFVKLFLAPKITHPLSWDIFRAGDVIGIEGTAPDPDFKNYVVEYGEVKDFEGWSASGIHLVDGGKKPVVGGRLATWDTSSIEEEGFYTIRLSVDYWSGITREVYTLIYLDPSIKKGWPQRIDWYHHTDSNNSEGKTSSKYYSSLSAINRPSNNEKAVTTTFKDDLVVVGDDYYAGSMLDFVVSDLDKDGKKELIFYVAGYPQKLQVFRQDGSLYCLKDVGPRDFGRINLHMPLVGDLNNDGYDEIVLWRFLDEDPDNSLLFVFDKDCKVLDGWPIYIHKAHTVRLAMADLNLDGKKEIIVKETDAINEMMTIINDQGEIISQWYLPNSYWSSDIESSPAVGNFDEDPELEIVSASPSDNRDGGVIYIYNIDGSVVEGWPVYTNGAIFSSPVVGDINNDGYEEIVVGVNIDVYAYPPDPPNGGLYVFDKSGNVLPGWPFEMGWEFLTTPALMDIDDDGDLEISATEFGYINYLLHHDGTVVDGWPQDTSWVGYHSSIAGDINDDKVVDVLITAGGLITGGGVYAWSTSGSVIDGFPKIIEGISTAPAVIDDIDADGKLELIASSDFDYDGMTDKYKMRGSVYVWELDGDYDESNLPWPMFMHDPQHTGRYNSTRKKPFIKSMLSNTGTKTISGRLFMGAGRKNETSVVTIIQTVVDKQVNVSAGSYLALDKEWANAGYFTPTDAGEYFVYAALLDERFNVIETLQGRLESRYEFNVSLGS